MLYLCLNGCVYLFLVVFVYIYISNNNYFWVSCNSKAGIWRPGMTVLLQKFSIWTWICFYQKTIPSKELKKNQYLKNNWKVDIIKYIPMNSNVYLNAFSKCKGLEKYSPSLRRGILENKQIRFLPFLSVKCLRDILHLVLRPLQRTQEVSWKTNEEGSCGGTSNCQNSERMKWYFMHINPCICVMNIIRQYKVNS